MPERLRWRRQPNERGLARVCQGWRGYQLWRGKELFATVARISLGRYEDGTISEYFYWYGKGMNTLATGGRFPSVDEAKADAMRYVREKV